MMTKRPTQIAILGGGVVGLNCALRLAPMYPVTIIASKFGYESDSWKASAIWHLYLVPESQIVHRWAQETLEHLISLAEDKSTGVVMLSGVELFRKSIVEHPSWAEIPPKFELLTNDELGLYNSVTQIGPSIDQEIARHPIVSGYSIEAPGADMSIYLPWLEDQVKSLGCQMRRQTVRCLQQLEVDFDVIVNCTGYESRNLVPDTSLFPHKGQYFVFKRDFEAPDHYIGDDDHPGGMAYVIPRGGEVLVGGSSDAGIEDLQLTLDFEDVKRRAGLYVPWVRSRLASDQARPPVVGIRPARLGGVRLEIDKRSCLVPVVHNYGHGGSGFSLAWGCAREVQSIIEEEFSH